MAADNISKPIKNFYALQQRWYPAFAGEHSIFSPDGILPSDKRLVNAIEQVIRAHAITGWRPEESPQRPMVVAWYLPEGQTVDWQQIPSHSQHWHQKSKAPAVLRHLHPEAKEEGDTVVIKPVSPYSPVSTPQGIVWTGTCLPALNLLKQHDKMPKHLVDLMYWADDGTMAAAGFIAARYRYPIEPIRFGWL